MPPPSSPHSVTPASSPEIELLPGRIDGPFRFEEMFGRSAPIEIEVGIGKGRFLIGEALARPGVDFLGLEWSLKHLRVAKERAARGALTNLRLHRADARHVLASLVPDRSLTRLHVYCPDPWPKKRHQKRRFFSPATVPHLERVLSTGGFLHLSTDVAGYFEEIGAVIAAHTGLRPGSDPLFPVEGGRGKTSYEVKYLNEGRVIHRACFTRLPDASANPARR